MTLQPNPGTTKKPTSNDIAYWMGRVDGRLEEIIGTMKTLTTRVEKVELRIEELDKKNYPPAPADDKAKDAERAAKDVEKHAITWQWVVEKLAVPLSTAFLLWFLFTLLPELVKGLP